MAAVNELPKGVLDMLRHAWPTVKSKVAADAAANSASGADAADASRGRGFTVNGGLAKQMGLANAMDAASHKMDNHMKELTEAIKHPAALTVRIEEQKQNPAADRRVILNGCNLNPKGRHNYTFDFEKMIGACTFCGHLKRLTA